MKMHSRFTASKMAYQLTMLIGSVILLSASFTAASDDLATPVPVPVPAPAPAPALAPAPSVVGAEKTQSGKTNPFDAELASLEKSNPSKEKNLLYYLEKGEMLRMQGDYAQSRDSWLMADEKIRLWEESVKIDAGKVLGDVGSFLINDTTRRYDGRDYEKVFVSVRLALNHCALGDMNAARTEIKKMHERESIIAEFRSKDLETAKKDAEKNGGKSTSTKELAGYPVETLDDPKVQALKNSYESAFANYLGGFVYEALDEPSLATAGYRKAIEMHPGDSTLEDGLKGLDDRISRVRQHKKGVDTLFVVETGVAPAIVSKTLPLALPIPSSSGLSMVMTPLSWPVINPLDASIVPNTITVDDKPQHIAMVTSVDLMARRAIADEMPGIIGRSMVRAVAKGIVQHELSSRMGMFGSILGGVMAVATEHADERTWRTLPAFYSVGRAMLTPGIHTVAVNTPAGIVTKEVTVSGNHAVVVLRSAGNSLHLAQSPYVEAIAEPEAPVVEVTAIEAPAVEVPAIEVPKKTDKSIKKKSNLKKG